MAVAGKRQGHWTFACTLSCPAVIAAQAKVRLRPGTGKIDRTPSNVTAIGTVEAPMAGFRPPGSDQRAACRVLRGSEDAPVQIPVGLLAEGHQDQPCDGGSEHDKREPNCGFLLYSTALVTEQKGEYRP